MFVEYLVTYVMVYVAVLTINHVIGKVNSLISRSIIVATLHVGCMTNEYIPVMYQSMITFL